MGVEDDLRLPREALHERLVCQALVDLVQEGGLGEIDAHDRTPRSLRLDPLEIASDRPGWIPWLEEEGDVS